MQRNCSEYIDYSSQHKGQPASQRTQFPYCPQPYNQRFDSVPLRHFLPRPSNEMGRTVILANQQHRIQNYQELKPCMSVHQFPVPRKSMHPAENVSNADQSDSQTQLTDSPGKYNSSFRRNSIVMGTETQIVRPRKSISQSVILGSVCEQKGRGLKFLESARRNREKLEQKSHNMDSVVINDTVKEKVDSNGSPLMPLSHLKKMKKSYIMQNNQGEFLAKRQVISHHAAKPSTYFKKKSMDCDWSPPSPLKLQLFQTSQPASSPKPPSLDDFEMIEKIGKGTFGDVSLARDRKTRFLCVLKALSKKKIKNLNLQEHVMREIKIQTYLSHRHIASLYGFFDDQNKIYLIMEYLPDGAISNRKKKISEPEAAYYVKQVCLGLAYMHQQNLIHRDIKPENLLTNDNYIKIGDFGCSVFSQSLRETAVGCYAYISPEQLSHTPYDRKIDAWSVGILTYELLYGCPPFEQQLIQIAKKQASSRNTSHSQTNSIEFDKNFPKLTFPPSNISNEAKDFISMLLTENSQDRVQIRDALKHKFILKQAQWQKHLQQKASII